MTDDLPPDDRDDELASLLEVPPLDDVTRERLVTRALDDAGPRRSARRLTRLLVPAAAALVALVLVGVGVFVLVNRDGDNAGTAAR
jgi:anti-sigma factor RsiW